MVLGILIAAVVAPGLLGSQEAIRQGQSKDKKEEHRARRCNLIATCIKSSSRSREINGRPVVLRNGKLWIDTTNEDGTTFGHICAGYYLPYPETNYEGLVTTVTELAPIMNWIYIDKETHEAKYGVRANAQPNLTGPFDCTRQDRRLTFDGWEGWCAVEEYEGYWCLYFDVDDDGLRSKISPGTRVLEIELSRKEKRFKKEKEARQQDQTTIRATDTKTEAPIDHPLPTETEVRNPGLFNEPLLEPEAMPKTPPTYSKSGKLVSRTNLGPSRRAVIDELDEFLATEAQATNAFIPSTLPQWQSMSPLPRSQQNIPLDENRIIPKLNRNSGSKTIAQAQMFEALAAAQTRNDDTTIARMSASKRASLASTNADSTSVYSEEDQILTKEIRPQSSISQITSYPVPTVLPVPLVHAQVAKTEKKLQASLSLRRPISSSYQEELRLTDSTVLCTSAIDNSKRKSQTSLLSQQKRDLKTFTIQRSGKRVSLRGPARYSPKSRVSSSAKKRMLSSTTRSLKEQSGSGRSRDRSQNGRKTTSAFLRDLDEVVNQELIADVSENGGKAQVFVKRLSARNVQRSEQRGGNGRANKRPLRNT